jgi:hypothetical protein
MILNYLEIDSTDKIGTLAYSRTFTKQEKKINKQTKHGYEHNTSEH